MRVDIPEATYHYHIKQLHQEYPDKEWQTLILETFKKHEGRYGYRRIHTELKAQGYIINHKKVQHIMQELDLKCEKFVRKSRYKSYKGMVGKVAKNRLNRRFYTPYAVQKVVTDVTEFKCTDDEKLYLSPIMDLYNGEVIGFSMSKRPTMDFVLDSLKQALPVIRERAEYEQQSIQIKAGTINIING